MVPIGLFGLMFEEPSSGSQATESSPSPISMGSACSSLA